MTAGRHLGSQRFLGSAPGRNIVSTIAHRKIMVALLEASALAGDVGCHGCTDLFDLFGRKSGLGHGKAIVSSNAGRRGPAV